MHTLTPALSLRERGQIERGLLFPLSPGERDGVRGISLLLFSPQNSSLIIY